MFQNMERIKYLILCIMDDGWRSVILTRRCIKERAKQTTTKPNCILFKFENIPLSAVTVVAIFIQYDDTSAVSCYNHEIDDSIVG